MKYSDSILIKPKTQKRYKMVGPSVINSINLTPAALFPNKENAACDDKCVIIANVIQQLVRNLDMSSITQNTLLENAEVRYADISKPERLSLPEADHKAFLLYQNGVSVDVAQKYYSYRLSESDANIWTIVVG
jgi:hypothetical protein